MPGFGRPIRGRRPEPVGCVVAPLLMRASVTPLPSPRPSPGGPADRPPARLVREVPSSQAAHGTNKPSPHGIGRGQASWRTVGHRGECALVPGRLGMSATRSGDALVPMGASVPVCHGRRLAKMTRCPALPDESRAWEPSWTRRRGRRAEESGPGDRLPTYQGPKVAPGPMRHGDPDILMEGPDGYQAGGGARVDEGAWDLGTGPTSSIEGSRSSSDLDDWIEEGSRQSIGHRCPGPWPSLASWHRDDQGGQGSRRLL